MARVWLADLNGPIDLSTPKWTILVHFGLENTKIQFGIRPFWPQWSLWPFWAILGPVRLPTYRGHSLFIISRPKRKFFGGISHGCPADIRADVRGQKFPHHPDLLFLAFLEFLAFFSCKEFLAFSGVFPFFPKDFGGSPAKKNPWFFGGFPCTIETGKKIRVSLGAQQNKVPFARMSLTRRRGRPWPEGSQKNFMQEISGWFSFPWKWDLLSFAF